MARASLHDLAERIAALQRSEHPGRRLAGLAGATVWEDVILGGKLAGAIVELLEAEEGLGAWTLALLMARQTLSAGKILVIADGERRFYPPAALPFLGDLQRTLVIRPRRQQAQQQATLTAMTQALRCAAVGAALGKLDRLSTTDCRRLQVAAESSGSVGLVLRPIIALSMPSFAAVRLIVASGARRVARGKNSLATHHSPLATRCLHVEIARLHGGPAGQAWTLEIDDEKGDVRLSAPVAAATSLAVPARASG